jgi:hypothetical protein
MASNINHRCDQHSSPYDCPDHLIVYIFKFDEYGIIVHDGGSSKLNIYFCPWCGTKLPFSKRDEWFDKIKALGLDPSDKEKIPKKYLTNEWYKEKNE